MNGENVGRVIADFKIIYPKVPKVGGARNEYSTYLHLAVCYLEYKALSSFIGAEEARTILLDFATNDEIYPWIYKQVLERTSEIEVVLKKTQSPTSNTQRINHQSAFSMRCLSNRSLLG